MRWCLKQRRERPSVSRSSTGVSLQSASNDGISDGILAVVEQHRHTGQAFPARLNIIARYVERMLSTSQDGQNPLK